MDTDFKILSQTDERTFYERLLTGANIFARVFNTRLYPDWYRFKGPMA